MQIIHVQHCFYEATTKASRIAADLFEQYVCNCLAVRCAGHDGAINKKHRIGVSDKRTFFTAKIVSIENSKLCIQAFTSRSRFAAQNVPTAILPQVYFLRGRWAGT